MVGQGRALLCAYRAQCRDAVNRDQSARGTPPRLAAGAEETIANGGRGDHGGRLREMRGRVLRHASSGASRHSDVFYAAVLTCDAGNSATIAARRHNHAAESGERTDKNRHKRL